jgi:hypothetical protein
MFPTLIGPAGFFLIFLKKSRPSIKNADTVQTIGCSHLFVKNLSFGKEAFS